MAMKNNLIIFAIKVMPRMKETRCHSYCYLRPKHLILIGFFVCVFYKIFQLILHDLKANTSKADRQSCDFLL